MLGDDGGPEPQPEERIGLLGHRTAPVSLGQHAQRAQLVFDEELDLVGLEAAMNLGRDLIGHLLVAVVTIGLGGHAVEQGRQLNDLAVGPAHQ